MKWVEIFFRYFFFVVVFLGVFLVFKPLMTKYSESTPIDVSGDSLEKYVSIEVNKHLDEFVSTGAIIQYQLEPIQTPIDSFRVIAQEYAADGAVLHSNLTYKIKYVGGIDDSEKESEAMAYSVVKDGKLYGSGVVFSEAISRAWAKRWALGYHSKDTGVSWPIYIGFAFVVFISWLFVWWLARIFARQEKQERIKNHRGLVRDPFTGKCYWED